MPDVNLEKTSPATEIRPTPEEQRTVLGAEQKETEEKAEPSAAPEASAATAAEADRSKARLLWLKKNPPTLPARDELTIKVEKIMEEGLAEAYQKLSPIAQQEFKLKGEETSTKIRELLNAAHLKVKKIFRLIYEWLKMLPGVNRFFLEQEAKIKTDRIIQLKNNR